MYNPFSLENKTILVTGASSGIGRATALECSRLGASVVATARNEERLEETFLALDRSLSQKHVKILSDLSTEEGIAELVLALPSLDGLSSNVGIAMSNSPIKFIKGAELQNVLQTNTFSHIFLAKMLFKKKLLNNGASCVFAASIGGVFSHGPGNAIYGISKAALESFVKYSAIEFAPKGVRCNCVCPGMIDTPLNNLAAITDEDRALDMEKYLLKRYGKPEEVAQTIAFLLSNASSFITGTSVIVDGGYTVNH